MIKKKLKVFKRFVEISLTLTKIGFYDVYEYFKILFGIDVDENVKPRKIREALERLGPSFIKLGQVLSTRPDIVPQPIIQELIKLQDKAKPIDYEVIRQVLEENYGDKLEEIFAYIDPKPVASASMSQVHLGYLQTGEKVAVKVKRPNIEQYISLDVEVLEFIVSVLERHFEIVKELNLRGLIYEFKHTTLREANFEIEANNIEIFRENFKDFKDFYIPKCFMDISNREVLVTEFLEGWKITDKENIVKQGFSLRRIVENLTDAYFKMVFVDGIFHADPHPGNLFVLHDGRIGCIDFGMVSRVSKDLKKLLYEHIIAVTTLDVSLAMRFYENLGMITPKTDIDAFLNDIEIFLEKYHNKTLEKIDMRELVLDLLDIIREHKLKLPRQLAYLGKTAINLEGIVREIYPDFNPTQRLQNFIKKSTADYIKEKTAEIKEALNTGYEFIFRLENLYRLIVRERLTLQIIFKDFEDYLIFQRKLMYRLIGVLLFTSFFIASGIFYLAGKERLGDIFLIFGIIVGIYTIIKILFFRKSFL
ncbi:MAG: AarF/ABC1/UbiB kinase family protein [Aquificae bacterium]|nr:AarF/ABC1/UbiB kinase family protein [Aquificota bacterium]